jgi:hypothetical protein
MKAREDFVPQLVLLFDGRPVRWAGPPQTLGDYEGNDRTLEVFNADAAEQLELLRRLRPMRDELESAAGGPVIIIFHTRKESARLYQAFLQADAAQRGSCVETSVLPLEERFTKVGNRDVANTNVAAMGTSELVVREPAAAERSGFPPRRIP